MYAQNIVSLQQALAPKQDLGGFARRWVALRNGQVIADASTAADLLHRADVTTHDAVIYVSPPDPDIRY